MEWQPCTSQTGWGRRRPMPRIGCAAPNCRANSLSIPNDFQTITLLAIIEWRSSISEPRNRQVMSIEHTRLQDTKLPWKKWGPYLSERQWGTVREDYSP